jgi:hypothetical protein
MQVFLLVPSSKASLQKVTALMEKYDDLRMDYADATYNSGHCQHWSRQPCPSTAFAAM